MRLDNPSISGSITYLGGGTNTIEGTDASLTGSFTGSFDGDGTGITGIISSSHAVTASYALTASHSENLIISGNISNVDYIDFITTIEVESQEGRLAWNSDEGTLDVGLENGSVLQVGQEQHWHVRNNTTASILNGQAVMATGALGASGRITIDKMIADGSIPAKYFLGIATQDIAADADGYVTTFGKVRGYDTSLIPSGSILWVDPATPGGLTTTEPSAPNLKLPVAFTLDAKNNGTIAVRATTGVRLSNSHDVQIDSATDGDLLVWSGSTWYNSRALTGSYELTGSLTVTDEIVAQTLHVQQVTSSIIYSSGSNIFGDQLTDTHQFTGSVSITGSSTFSNYGDAHFLNGDVGIGTDLPSAKLHVHSTSGDGLIRVTGDNIINSGGAIKGFNNGLAFNVAPSGGGSEIEAIRINGSGSVGIGTNNPSGTYGKLTVNGSISLLDDQNTKLEIGRYSSGASNSYIKLGANSNSLRITNNTDTADLLYINNDGSILIGQATKRDQEKFAVVGNTLNYLAEIRETGTGGDENSGLLIYYPSAAPNSRSKHFLLNADNTATKSFLSSDGGAYFSGDVGIGDSTPNFVTSGRRVLELNGSSEALMSFAINGSWQYYIQTTSTGIFHSSGGKDFVIDTGNSNVGIGTTSPATTLNVQKPTGGGEIFRLRGGNYNNVIYAGGLSISSNTSTNYNRYWEIDASADLTFNRKVTNDDSTDGTPLVLTQTSIGIGITPSQKLHLHNTSGDFSAETTIRGSLSAGTPKAEIAFKRGTSGDGAGIVLRASNSSGTLSDSMIIKDGDGNVGINETNPEATLHVNGSIIQTQQSKTIVFTKTLSDNVGTDIAYFSSNPSAAAVLVTVIISASSGYAVETKRYLWSIRRATAGTSRNVTELTGYDLGSVNAGVVTIDSITAVPILNTSERFRLSVAVTGVSESIAYVKMEAVGDNVKYLDAL